MENKKLKVLNLYAGIGGNRKLWTNVDVTAVEIDKDIAEIYSGFFPQDKVIVADAHQYLLEHYQEFDFIWSSPPCPSHSRLRRFLCVENKGTKPIFPDMKLYEEIIFLMSYFKGKFVVENVKSYYNPLIKPQELKRHYFWCNFPLPKKEFETKDIIRNTNEIKWFDLSKYEISNKDTLIKNCVNPFVGLHIFELAFKKPQLTLLEQKGGLNSSQP